MELASIDPEVNKCGPIAAWPAEVDFILSVLETASFPEDDARMCGRCRYHVIAQLEIQGAGAEEAITLYTRDISARSLGFITRTPLPLRHAGAVRLLTPANGPQSIPCTVFRCRPLGGGWFEGAVFFNTCQEGLPLEKTASSTINAA